MSIFVITLSGRTATQLHNIKDGRYFIYALLILPFINPDGLHFRYRCGGTPTAIAFWSTSLYLPDVEENISEDIKNLLG